MMRWGSSLGAPLKWYGLAMIAAVIVACAPSHARACGACVCYSHGVDAWAFPDHSRAAPLNLRMFVWLDGKDESTLRLTTSGSEVPFQLTPAGRPGAYWLEPIELLAPSTEYVLEVAALPSTEAWGPFMVVLTTGVSEDHVPPAVGGMSSSEGGREEMCGASVGAGLQIRSIFDEGVDGGALIVQLDLETTSGAERLFLPFNAFTASQNGAFGSSLDPSSQCFGYRGLGSQEEGAIHAGTATVWDWSGNATEVGDLTFAATRVDPGGCPGPSGHGGCTAARETDDGGLLLPAVIALALQVRRRRSAR